jgi:hypothetical protein
MWRLLHRNAIVWTTTTRPLNIQQRYCFLGVLPRKRLRAPPDTPNYYSIFQRKTSRSSQSQSESKRQNPNRNISTSSSSSSSTSNTNDVVHRRQIFCDLDGVLVDFQAGVAVLEKAHFASPQHAHKPFPMWNRIQRTPHFYRTLPWTADGKDLWKAIATLRPHILTGVPWATSTAARDKFDWCQRELLLPPQVKWQWRNMVGSKKTHVRVNLHRPLPSTTTTTSMITTTTAAAEETALPTMAVITCWSQNKPCECRRPGDILIDDRPDANDVRARWEQAGGVFIHHTSARETIQGLMQLGVLPHHQDDDKDNDDDAKEEEEKEKEKDDETSNPEHDNISTGIIATTTTNTAF